MARGQFKIGKGPADNPNADIKERVGAAFAQSEMSSAQESRGVERDYSSWLAGALKVPEGNTGVLSSLTEGLTKGQSGLLRVISTVAPFLLKFAFKKFVGADEGDMNKLFSENQPAQGPENSGAGREFIGSDNLDGASYKSIFNVVESAQKDMQEMAEVVQQSGDLLSPGEKARMGALKRQYDQGLQAMKTEIETVTKNGMDKAAADRPASEAFKLNAGEVGLAITDAKELSQLAADRAKGLTERHRDLGKNLSGV